MKYPFSVSFVQVNDHLFWIAESKALRGCVAQGETIEEALCELAENEAVWLETATDCGFVIPEITVEPLVIHSGKFTVRISPKVHEDAAKQAKLLGISLNQYVNDAIVAWNTGFTVVDSIRMKV